MKKFLALFCIMVSMAGAQDHDQMIKEFLEMRKRMLDRVFKDFDNFDSVFDDPFFKDNGMDDQFFHRHFRSRSSRGRSMEPFVHEWVQDGKRKVLVIVPRSKETQIELEVDSSKKKILLKHREQIEQKDNNGQTVQTTMSEAKTYLSYPEGVLKGKNQTHQIEGKLAICFPIESLNDCENLAQVKELMAKIDRKVKSRDRRAQRDLKRKRPKERRYFKGLKPGEGDINI